MSPEPEIPPAPTTTPSAEGLSNVLELGSKIGEINSKITSLNDQFSSIASGGLLSFITSTGQAASTSDKLITALSRYPTALSGMTAAITGANQITGLITGSGKMQSESSRIMNENLQATGSLLQGLAAKGGLLGALGQGGTNIQQQATAFHNLFEILKQGKISTGEFLEFQRSVGGPAELGKLQKVQEHLAMINETANQTGDVTGTMLLANQLANVKGGLEGMVSAADAGTAQNRSLMTSIKDVAAALGISDNQMISFLQDLRTKSGVQSYALEGQAAQAMKLKAVMKDYGAVVGADSDLMTQKTLNLASAFRIQGNNALSLAEPLATVALRLQKVGLNTEDSLDLSEKYVKNLSNLTMAQKMYYSELTGGPGGAEGAFQIQQKISEGKASEVFAQAEEAIKKQLGEVVSEEDAAMGGSAAANERLRQYSLLAATPMASGMQEAEIFKLLDSYGKKEEAEEEVQSKVDVTGSEALRKATMDAATIQATTASVRTPEQLLDLQRTSLGIMGGGAASQALMGNISPESVDTKRDLLSRLDTGGSVARGPKSYQEGLSPELTRPILESSAQTLQVVFQGLKDAGGSAIESLREFAAQLSSSGDVAGLIDMPTAQTLPTPALQAAQAAPRAIETATTAGTTRTSASAATMASEGSAGAIPFLCGGCHRTYLGKVHELAQHVRTR